MFINLICAALAPTHFSHALWLTLFSALSLLAGATHYRTTSYKDSSGATVMSKTETVAGNAEADFDQVVPIAANTHYAFNLTRSQLKTLALLSDQNITIYTNDLSSGSPTDTIALVAGIPMCWTLGTDTLTAGLGLVKCPITADVTAGLYITNAAASAANLKIRAVLAT